MAEMNGNTTKVKVLNRVVLSKLFITSDASVKGIAETYVKKTAEFGKLLKEVKDTSKALKEALESRLKGKIDLDAGTEWRVTEGEDKGTLVVEVIEKRKPEGSRSRVPTATLHCTTFDDKRRFLVEHVERVIYDSYRVTVIGSVPIKMQLGNSQEIETRKLAFCLRGEIDRTTLHKKPRKKFACRLRFLNRNGSRSYGASGRVMNGAHRSLTSGVRPPAATQSRRNSKDFLGFRSCVLRST